MSNTKIGLLNGGTGSSLTDPGADRILFWDDSAGSVTWLTLGTGLAITGTTLDSTSTGLTNWTESYSAGTQATSDFSAIGAGSNINGALIPKGTGALLGAKPDASAAGGNSRGTYAVDWQLIRSAATMVSSGTKSVIAGGEDNTASGLWTVIGGGFGNYVNSNGGSVLSGYNNSNSATYSVICGGESNVIQSGLTDDFIGGGVYNNINAYGSVIVGGESNTITGGISYAMILGGYFNNVSAASGFAYGRQSKAYLTGGASHANGTFSATNGDCQNQKVHMRRAENGKSSGGTMPVYIDGSADSPIPLGSNRTWGIQVKWNATVVAQSGTTTGIAVGDMCYGVDQIAFAKVGGTSTVVQAVNGTVIGNTTFKTSSMAYTAGGSQEFIPTFTIATFAGGGTVDVKISAKVEFIEIAW